MSYVIDGLINLECDTTGEYDRLIVHKAFQNLSSSKSIGSDVACCILNMLMQGRLVDESECEEDDEINKHRSATRILQALLETPKGIYVQTKSLIGSH